MMPGYFGSTTQFRLQWVSTRLCAYKMYLLLVQEKQYWSRLQAGEAHHGCKQIISASS